MPYIKKANYPNLQRWQFERAIWLYKKIPQEKNPPYYFFNIMAKEKKPAKIYVEPESTSYLEYEILGRTTKEGVGYYD